MGRTAEVLSAAHVTDAGGHGVDVVCDPDGGRNVTVAHYTPPGVDALPLPGDTAALEDSSGMGCEHATGYGDTNNAGKTAPGEVRLYARDAKGAVIGDLWLKRDGTIVGTNESGSLELSPTGVLSVSGSIDSAALASVVDKLIHVLRTWAVSPSDGGAALQAAMNAAFTSTPTSASRVLKVGG